MTYAKSKYSDCLATAWQLLDSLTIIYIETLSYFKVKPVTAMFIIFSNDGLTLKASIRWLYWYSVAILAQKKRINFS